ncbi:MAG: energy-coupling factor ABC transporter ATP-binding protein [Planctomycetota bacterium]|jgi:cobalt/nickel transport system ATP-binding protein|nr:energy-coupling factor ABC transporter ATP-binding protein [Planctomycetota bacterium]
MDLTPILSLERITFAYPGRPALFREFSLSLGEGERLGLHGPNGSGKTTLLRLIVGLETPQAGGISYRGRLAAGEAELRELRRGVGLVMQNSDDQLFSATVLEETAFGPLNLGLRRREARDRAMETLEGLGLAELAGRATHRLSMGEKKMVALASVLSMRPGALLLDEPAASLDDDSRGRIIDILRRQALARIVVAHDRDFLRQTASTFIRLGGPGGPEPVPEL